MFIPYTIDFCVQVNSSDNYVNADLVDVVLDDL